MTCICSTILFLHIFCCSETKSKRPLLKAYKGQIRPRPFTFSLTAAEKYEEIVSYCKFAEGQEISKANYFVLNSPKK